MSDNFGLKIRAGGEIDKFGLFKKLLIFLKKVLTFFAIAVNIYREY